MMGKIRKLVVAVVGLAVLLVYKWTGLDIGGVEPALVEGVLAVLTAIGVYAVRNDPPDELSSR
ncbi:MAG: hypothetical protein LAT55_13825 [Opitutales bacterium]|nr:hypothetical protein [Opitutales bacterium]